jgi:hypothetical protein
MNVNYLGAYESISQIWEAHPEGGREGDYIEIGEVQYSWDKYTSAWVLSTPEERSEQKPIVVNSEEGVVEYSDGYINYLGVFDSLAEVWEAYPEGGKEGDYILVDGQRLKWNKYSSNWGAVEMEGTPARAIATLYGDLHVHNDVVVGEDLIAAIFERYATKKELSKVIPLRIESEDIIEDMIQSGSIDNEQIYYVPEED